MPLPRTIRLFNDRWGWSCLALLVVQQVIVASSTLWLAQLVAAIHAERSVWLSLGLYLASLLLPYLPGGAALIALSIWRQRVWRQYVDGFVTAHAGRVSAWSDHETQAQRVPLLTTEGPETLTNTVSYGYGLVSCALNVGLNILVLATVVEPMYALGYGGGVLLVALVLKFQAPIQARFAQEAQQARVDLGQTLLTAWDNVLLGNRYHRTLWVRQWCEYFQLAARRTIGSDAFHQGVSIGIALLTMLPTVGVLVFAVHQHARDSLYLATLVVTLPRLFMILGFTHELLSFISQWPMQRARLHGLGTLLTPPPSHDLAARIQRPGLQIEHNGVSLPSTSMTALLPLTATPGRITIRGANGTGKSSLLLQLKSTLGDSAYYLPAQHRLLFACNGPASTGQRARSQLEEIATQAQVQVLLLDEWDANLDADNQQRLSEQIDALARSHCVIEVRHRHEA